ncbi:MAG TPA: hypothetical protein V6D05_15375 [Stenomitos sp.]
MMNRKAVSSLGLAMTLALLGSTAALADTKVINGPTTTTPDVVDGKPGNWISYTEYTFATVEDSIRQLADGKGLSEADILTLIQYFGNMSPTPSQDAILAKINQIAADKAMQAVLDAWKNSAQANQRLNAYGQAGGLAYQLALSMMQAAANAGAPVSGPAVTFSLNTNEVNWAYNEAGRGWPLQAAMIHSGEYARSGQSIPKSLLLKAWDVVWANVQAHGWSLSDPIVLDLNGNGKIDVTGKSSAKFRNKANKTFVAGGSVLFDLLATGKPVRTEWVKPGDGFLVDNRKNAVRKLIEANKPISTANLFGDTEGHLSGFFKLAREFDPNAKLASTTGMVPKGLGIIKGDALKDLLVWKDNGDGKVTENELYTLASLGITELKLPARFVLTRDGEYLDQATFVQNGKNRLMQEVWFAHESLDKKGAK